MKDLMLRPDNLASKRNHTAPFATSSSPRPRDLSVPLLQVVLSLTAMFIVAQPLRAQGEAARQPVIRFVRNPDPAPDFKLPTLDGKPLSLAGSRGKVILLNFWATWCGPCLAEIPDLIELQTKYKDRLQIIGLTVDDENPVAITKMVQETGINYPVAIASPAVRFKYGGIAALPTSFVLDSEGRVVQKHEGLRDPALYETEIRALLGLPINARVDTFEDTGEIFLAHADRANQLPGVDLSKLTEEQKQVALHRFNAETCSCGCKFTLAQCRIYDRNCAISKDRTAKIVAGLSAAGQHSAEPAATPATNAPGGEQPRR
jgi:cytochrome c biogenesis protein CcmG, thiol:disulfide interchange protein DsbE